MKFLTISCQTLAHSFFLVLLLLCVKLNAQKSESQRIAFYNLENLFHPENDSLKNDDEYTPEGKRNWSIYRYHEKLNHMAKAILSIGEWLPPTIVGVAEVENKQALEDLISTEVLRKFNYGIIHFESPDRRGIDVGMLYRKDEFTPIASRPIPVKMHNDPNFVTRDILYCKGIFNKKDTVHLLFCHWPSRYGGQARSEPKRIQAALTLKHITDSLNMLPYPTYVIAAGDFNDEWTNISLHDTLKAQPLDTMLHGKSLINLMATLPPTQGSHRYRGTWSYLDQIIVSSSLLSNEAISIKDNTAKVTTHGFLLTTDDKYPGSVPFRTFLGYKYQGGFSDHLPVYVDLIFK
ncbi:putative extracellular nuclease [Owenweeksia hongkongensis DSM 17368]|uniref:Putative extracellular nuclease n=1 Tax=Owenweeksia hongkongensis (strain DSM 17368 / CIP 108786 / JCM 12287 / NRRL B-23963 / UST20020801) TaxID=926562 RepID=G8R6N0_OWEHD|nr:endonuclease/exonuclease/phosphatase family protein [Owenweeksia hongkongensis]AEV31173.1 putative extracellular nuclease [Owenweeksia hongkongensis DSM 17368]